MSYDLYLLRVSPGKDALAEALSLLEQETEEINPGLPNPENEARKKVLARELLVVNPQFEIFEFDYAEIAGTMKISEQEARRRYRHIELNSPEDGNGIQISLYDDTASLAIPYWHQNEKAKQVWLEAWPYLECLQRHGGLSIYDPQLEEILDLSEDLDEVVKVYSWAGGALDQAVEAAKSKKPWWKVW